MKVLAPSVVLVLAFAAPLGAQTPPPGSLGTSPTAQTKPAATYTEGEVRRMDKGARKVTLRHGPITNLDMPAMTMVFEVKDAALLDKISVGDKVRFVAEKSGDTYFVTRMEPAKP